MAEPALIMVVDDDADIRHIVATNLRSIGFEVIEAESGAQALDLFVSKKPGIILLDVMMPHMNGIETATKLRALDKEGDLQLVFLTAHGDIETFRQSLTVNARDFMTKPITRGELIKRVSLLQTARSLRPPKR
jgi:DNA-binding response OmpR family regulator